MGVWRCNHCQVQQRWIEFANWVVHGWGQLIAEINWLSACKYKKTICFVGGGCSGGCCNHYLPLQRCWVGSISSTCCLYLGWVLAELSWPPLLFESTFFYPDESGPSWWSAHVWQDRACYPQFFLSGQKVLGRSHPPCEMERCHLVIIIDGRVLSLPPNLHQCHQMPRITFFCNLAV